MRGRHAPTRRRIRGWRGSGQRRASFYHAAASPSASRASRSSAAASRGLTCAHRLWGNKRIQAQLYEWDTRVGGRIQTLRGYFPERPSHRATRGVHLVGASRDSEPRATFRPHAREHLCRSQGRRERRIRVLGHALRAERAQRGLAGVRYKLFRDAIRKAPRANFPASFGHRAQMGPYVRAGMDREICSRRVEQCRSASCVTPM